MSYILSDMRKEAIDNEISSFAEEWCVSKKSVSYAADRFEYGDTEIPGLNNLKKTADYDKYAEKHSEISKFKYHQTMKKSLLNLLKYEIVPLRDDDYAGD